MENILSRLDDTGRCQLESAMRYSLRTLLIFVTIFSLVGVTWVYWPFKQGIVSTHEFHWYDYSVGIVDDTGDGKLQHHGQTDGGGTYITLREGEHYPRSTGGWYYQVGIQLPREIKATDVFDLSPASAGRHLEPVGEFDRLGFLRPNEFVALYFGNPYGDCMACDDANSHGRLEVVSITRELVTFKLELHADIPDVWDVDIDRTFTLPRE